MEYIQSELYQEIVETYKRTDAERKVKKEATLNMKAIADAEKKEYNDAVLKLKNAVIKDKYETFVERKERRETSAKMKVAACTERAFAYAELKREIIDLKKDVKEMLRLIHELYEFESQ